MKSYDLIRKFGWESLTFLSNMGVNLLADSNVFFVDNGATEASDATDDKHGTSFEYPFSTANYAVSQCDESNGDVILLAPGHAETINDLGVDGESGDETDELVMDKAGVTLLGIGSGLLRPTFTMGSDDVTASINITAANCTIRNIIIQSNLADVTTGITISAVTGTTIEDCYIRDGAANEEMVIGITAAANADDLVIKNCVFSTFTGGDCASAVKFVGGCDRCELIGNIAQGTYSVSAFDLNQAASTEMIIKDNILTNQGAATLELHTNCTGVYAKNFVAGTTSIAAAVTGIEEMWPFENYVTGEDNKSAIIDPAVDSE